MIKYETYKRENKYHAIFHYFANGTYLPNSEYSTLRCIFREDTFIRQTRLTNKIHHDVSFIKFTNEIRHVITDT